MIKKVAIIVSVVLVLAGLVAAAVIFRSRALREGTEPPASVPVVNAPAPSVPTVTAPPPGKIADFFVALGTAEVAYDHLVIKWAGTEPTTGIIQYGKTDKYEIGTVAEAEMAVSHETRLSNLAPGTAYYVRLVAKTSDGKEKTAENQIFETPAAPTK